MGEDLSRVEQTAAIAPLLLSGEAAMEERSTIDRVVVVRLTDGKNPEALDMVLDFVADGGGGVFGRRLIEWQLANLDRLRRLVPSERNRQEQGLAVLRWGWAMFTEFIFDEFGIDLVWELDLSRVTAQREDVADYSPEVEALLEALDLSAHESRDDPIPVAWIEPGVEGALSVVAFRPRALWSWATKGRGYPLPGDARAMKQLLMDRYVVLSDDKVYYQIPGLGADGKRRPRAVRLLGVIEADTEKDRATEIRKLEAGQGGANGPGVMQEKGR